MPLFISLFFEFSMIFLMVATLFRVTKKYLNFSVNTWSQVCYLFIIFHEFIFAVRWQLKIPKYVEIKLSWILTSKILLNEYFQIGCRYAMFKLELIARKYKNDGNLVPCYVKTFKLCSQNSSSVLIYFLHIHI